MKQYQIEVEKRETLGKGASNQYREKGLIPAMLYGGKSNLPLLINDKIFRKTLSGHSWRNMLINLKVNNGSEMPLTLIKEIQTHPISGQIKHVDFFEISSEKMVRVDVKLNFLGTPIGVKQGGGILSLQRRNIRVECLAEKMPEEIDVDISTLDVGKSIHIRDIEVSDGIRIIDDPRITLSVVNKSRESIKSEEDEASEEGKEAEKKA